MSPIRTRLQLSILKLSHRKNRYEQAFTLVELMIVVVVVGILSAVALPQFLGVKDKAQIGTQIGEAVGLAKECSASVLIDGPYPDKYVLTKGTTPSGLKIDGDCNGGDRKTPPAKDVKYETIKTVEDAEGTNCGGTAMTKGQKCTIAVSYETGKISYTAN